MAELLEAVAIMCVVAVVVLLMLLCVVAVVVLLFAVSSAIHMVRAFLSCRIGPSLLSLFLPISSFIFYPLLLIHPFSLHTSVYFH